MKRYTYFFICSVILTGSACKKDFLEVIDKTKILRQGYVVDLPTTEHYMNGIYGELATSVAGLFNMPIPEITADNLKLFGSVSLSQLGNFYNWTQTTTLDESGGAWYDNYRIIRACNFVIEKSDEYKDQDLAKAAMLKGQALCIRAWMHFSLVNLFAQSFNYSQDASHLGVPYIYTSDIEERVTRQTVAEVYEAMIADLKEALQLLPATGVTNKQYINYQAGKALLARIYLFKSDYNMAKYLAGQVLQDVPMMIADYPAKLYTSQESEALFQIPPGSSQTANYTTDFYGRYCRRTIRFTASNDIVQLYRAYPSDKRNSWILDSTIGKVVTKFPKGVTGTHTMAEADFYQTFFRSTEMALTAAEAYAMLGNDDSARYFANEIRVRAGIPVIAPTIMGAALIDSIKIERRKEMAFEGIRMFDLLRWKQNVNRKDALTPAAQLLPYPSDKSISPIPFADVQIAGLSQNPGY
ncbi:RagB/SusD family nutrient uptake outer membrane protein [Longitalea arenae]|uniref:RagB/SusD family nutrient uptake outer membrane protein n=1 Tax=Longitalea arenae TaxID=2812558 RepID=UPI0019688C82|nr:RagB/SusD family nutrient uptake outer membrane protein [Longitalea arenae]